MRHFVQAVLFDLNETLVNQVRTEQSHIAVTYTAFARLNWDITFESFAEAWAAVHSRFQQRLQKGYELLRMGDLRAAQDMLREPWYSENISAVAAELNIPLSKRLVEEITWQFQDSWVEGLRMPEANAVILNQLSDAGYQLGIITNFQQPNIIDDILSTFKVRSLFDSVVVSATFGCRKPHPAIFLEALGDLGLKDSPEKAVYVGDELVEDIAGAKAVRLRPVLLDQHGHHRGSGVEIPQISSLYELPDVLATMENASKQL